VLYLPPPVVFLLQLFHIQVSGSRNSPLPISISLTFSSSVNHLKFSGKSVGCSAGNTPDTGAGCIFGVVLTQPPADRTTIPSKLNTIHKLFLIFILTPCVPLSFKGEGEGFL